MGYRAYGVGWGRFLCGTGLLDRCLSQGIIKVKRCLFGVSRVYGAFPDVLWWVSPLLPRTWIDRYF